MPKSKSSVKIGVLLHESAIPTMALLMRDVFLTANYVLKETRYLVDLISSHGRPLSFGDVTVNTIAAKKSYDYILVTPFSPSGDPVLQNWKEEAKFIQSAHAKKIKIASPCLGSILLAQSGILNGKEATTHWAFLDFARMHFPEVKWNSKDMLCKAGSVLTAGGYLAAVDLVLYIISESSGKKTAHEVGQVLLAESSRQKQSVFATSLISQRSEPSPFQELENRIARDLDKALTVKMMADWSRMSLRNFQRQFTSTYGVSPNNYLQLKRIEKAKILLRDTRLSLESVLEKIGMSDISSFRKLFRREIGMTPAEFRKRIS